MSKKTNRLRRQVRGFKSQVEKAAKEYLSIRELINLHIKLELEMPDGTKFEFPEAFCVMVSEPLQLPRNRTVRFKVVSGISSPIVISKETYWLR